MVGVVVAVCRNKDGGVTKAWDDDDNKTVAAANRTAVVVDCLILLLIYFVSVKKGRFFNA